MLALSSLLLGLLDRATQISGLLQTAQAEGRDVTAAELDALFALDHVAKLELQNAIDAARAAAAQPDLLAGES